MTDAAVIDIRSLSRRFGAKAALDDVTLSVPPGSVFGLIGENGAGKTTLIKHILGLYRAQIGSVRVFGKDPVADPVGVLGQIGYLSEESDLPGWMRVDELMYYMRSFYPGWSDEYAEKLRADFGLDRAAKIKSLSKGQRARAGLIAALAYRPDLLLLDEPSSGLDPLVRRDILGAIVRTIADEGRTVVFSSHLLAEVERVADYVAMVKDGRILFCDELDAIKQSHLRMTIQFDAARSSAPPIKGGLAWDGGGREWTAVFQGQPPDIEAAVVAGAGTVVARASISLDDIFVAHSSSRVVATSLAEG
jgi:ABC-2 type transport system ATP-binding protein